jgi:hypothetical protein
MPLFAYALAEKYGYEFPLKTESSSRRKQAERTTRSRSSPQHNGAGRAPARAAEERTFQVLGKSTIFALLTVF